ncbi:MAG: hypothetical protein M1436_07915 [Acidobacteria bacterium]|nr:hypothetical protein [Acidobacteriota bacterium]
MNPNFGEMFESLQSVGRNNIDAFTICDSEFLRAQATPAFESIRKFQASDRFIRMMEDRKAERQGLSAAEEREALYRTVETAHEVRSIVARTWRVVRHLETAGTLERLLVAARDLAFSRGSFRTTELWDTVLGVTGVSQYLDKNGFHIETIREFTQALRSHDRVFKVRDGALVVEPPDSESPGPSDELSTQRSRRIRVERRRRPVTAGTLWEEDWLSAAITAIEQPGVLGIQVFRDTNFGEAWEYPEELDPVEVLVSEGAMALQEMESSAALVAHSGLPVHHGADPFWWIVVAVVAVALIVVSIVFVIVCAVSDEFKKNNKTTCDAFSWISIIGILALMGSACAQGANCKVVVSVQSKGSELLATDPAMGPLA